MQVFICEIYRKSPNGMVIYGQVLLLSLQPCNQDATSYNKEVLRSNSD